MGSTLITPDPGTIIWTIITFTILVLLLGRFAWKPLMQVLEERERTVRDSLEQARRARDESEETLRRNREILANARRETAAIIEQGKREAEALRGEILARSRKEAHDLVEQGKRQVLYEQKRAMETLRSQVADLAIRAAERLISRSLDERKQRELVEEYMRTLPAMYRGESRG
ncbi:MAG: F0F1 ATP synthase subunit B [Acidobacteriota bacterium]